MAVTVRQEESSPAAYPAPPEGLSDGVPKTEVVWQRLESYISHRWTEREVIWTIEGEGDWTPPLTPAVITGAEKWENNNWTAVVLPEGPYGYCLPSDGPYRITATVGGGDVPATVSEAFRRLAEYSAEITSDGVLTGHPAHNTHSADIGDSVAESFNRPSNWAARAMQMSGAADLLRPYRRAS